MNRENIQIVRDVIAGLPPQRFSMEFWAAGDDGDIAPTKLQHTCDTAGCVAGWTVAALAKRAASGTFDQAMGLLDLTLDEANELFLPIGHGWPGHYTQPHAVRVLDHLLATGKVNWKSTRRAKKAIA